LGGTQAGGGGSRPSAARSTPPGYTRTQQPAGVLSEQAAAASGEREAANDGTLSLARYETPRQWTGRWAVREGRATPLLRGARATHGSADERKAVVSWQTGRRGGTVEWRWA
jgi:hypothetical protein